MTSARWYVVQSRPNSERKAAHHLERQGYEVYLPRYLKRRSHARKIEVVPAALFPGYLFVAIDMANQRWRSIQSTVGVANLVCRGEGPATVPSGIVASLKHSEDENGFVRVQNTSQLLPGMKVRVLSGAFMDNLGQFERMADRERVAILLDLLGQKVRVILDGDLVAAA
jgi:transcriptional antiterminator RfaH